MRSVAHLQRHVCQKCASAGEAFDPDTWAQNAAYLAKYYADQVHEFALAEYLLAAAEAAAKQAPEHVQVPPGLAPAAQPMSLLACRHANELSAVRRLCNYLCQLRPRLLVRCPVCYFA